MKKIHFLLLVLSSVVVFSSCKKEVDPYFQDYYNNKIISLNITSTDMSSTDNFTIRASAIGVDLIADKTIKLLVNGEEAPTKYVDIASDLIKDGCTITTKDSAWQIIMTYKFINDNGATSVTITPSFNDESQEPIHIYLDPNTTKSGTLEIKYHQ